MFCIKNLLPQSLRRSKFRSLLLLTGVLLIIYMKRTPHIKRDLYFSDQNVIDLALREGNRVPLRKTGRLPERIVHLDFKGAPPKVEYVLSLIPYLKSMEATGILIEYENTFPYRDGLEEFQALNAYTWSEVSAIARTAEENNLTVIPLLPTLSHLEFVLKREKYKFFRESPNNPQTICPSKSGVYDILFKMIDQMLSIHSKSKYVHIGCDEASLLGVCPRCKSVMKKGNLRKGDIYLGHIRKIAEYINNTYVGVRTIVWGNEIASQEWPSLFRNRIPDLVDIMLSGFKIDLESFPPEKDMTFYAQFFPKLWIAGSYKGTTGKAEVVADEVYHSLNFKLWADFIEQWKSEIDFKGIVLIGWQKQSHFDVLCELLPVSIPSLALNLRSVYYGDPDLDYDDLKQLLQCNDFVPMNPKEILDVGQLTHLQCNFPGFDAYHAIYCFFQAFVLVKGFLLKLEMDELAFYNIIHSQCKPYSYVDTLETENFRELLLKVGELENKINSTLLKYYDRFTVNEWMAANVLPVLSHLQAALHAAEALVKTGRWSRHPGANAFLSLNDFFNEICRKDNIIE